MSHHRDDRWTDAITQLEATIVAEVVDTIERAKDAGDLRVIDLADRAHLSKRMVTLVRKLQVRPSLRTLLALLDAVGLEMHITVRRKRHASTREAPNSPCHPSTALHEAQTHGHS